MTLDQYMLVVITIRNNNTMAEQIARSILPRNGKWNCKVIKVSGYLEFM